jgi:predicted aspartyl protease
MSTTAYNYAYYPPAPTVSVQIAASANSNRSVPYEALIDTGSDGTFVARAIIRELDLPITYTAVVRTHLREDSEQVEIYRGDLLLFGTLLLPGIEFICDEWGDGVILGRDVLNRLQLLLDGPGETVRIED